MSRPPFGIFVLVRFNRLIADCQNSHSFFENLTSAPLNLFFSSQTLSCSSALTFLPLTLRLFIASLPTPTTSCSFCNSLSSACFLGWAAALLAISSGLSLGKSAVASQLKTPRRVAAQQEWAMEGERWRLRWIPQIMFCCLVQLKWHCGKWQWEELFRHSCHIWQISYQCCWLLCCSVTRQGSASIWLLR